MCFASRRTDIGLHERLIVDVRGMVLADVAIFSGKIRRDASPAVVLYIYIYVDRQIPMGTYR